MKDIVQSYNKSCYACGSYTTYRQKSGVFNWYTNKPTSLYLCRNCWMRYISNPISYNAERSLRYSKKRSPRRIVFKNRQVALSYHPRTGICSNCGDKTKTSLHHKEYYIIFKWFATIELCISCHSRITMTWEHATGIL